MVEDVEAGRTWQALEADPDTHLVDVRTEAEWSYVGIPELSALGKRVLLIAWQGPNGARNPAFLEQLQASGLTPQHEVHFICRSGARSLAAAEAARGIGYTRVYNVADGFEGPPDQDGHRGSVAGWKATGLPWRQG